MAQREPMAKMIAWRRWLMMTPTMSGVLKQKAARSERRTSSEAFRRDDNVAARRGPLVRFDVDSRRRPNIGSS
jgi:hypothetical protein